MKTLRKKWQGLKQEQSDRESKDAAGDVALTHEQEEAAALIKKAEDAAIGTAGVEYYKQKSIAKHVNDFIWKMGAAQRKA